MVGQLLASRPDALPKVYCDELGRLFDSSTYFANGREVAEESLRESHGRDFDDVFSEFTDIPIAAASIGQTHRARLRVNGRLVAVKVRRPSAEESFRRDLRLVKRLTGFFGMIGTDRLLEERAMAHGLNGKKHTVQPDRHRNQVD